MNDTRFPLEVELHDLKVNYDNSVHAVLVLPDGIHLEIDFAENSPAVNDLLELLTSHLSAAFAELGSRGLIVTRLTPVEGEQ